MAKRKGKGKGRGWHGNSAGHAAAAKKGARYSATRAGKAFEKLSDRGYSMERLSRMSGGALQKAARGLKGMKSRGTASLYSKHRGISYKDMGLKSGRIG